MGGENLVVARVAGTLEQAENFSPGLTSVVLLQVGDVLQKDILRLMVVEDSNYVPE